MAKFWDKLFQEQNSKYNFEELVDCLQREPNQPTATPIQIVCDIDKTYLETKFESVLHMARVAFESANKKITVRGATDVLLASRWGDKRGPITEPGYPRSLHFVSSSPPQLRAVLEEKLVLDGLDWTSDTFKNQAYNVKKARFDLLRQHVAYKSAAILNVISQTEGSSKFYFIGDNAESDTYIYVGIYLFATKVLNTSEYSTYLEIAGIEDTVAKSVATRFENIPEIEIGGILIRNAPGYNFVNAPGLTEHIRCFDNYLQAGLMLINWEVIPESLLYSLCRTFHNQHWFRKRIIREHLLTLEKQSKRKEIKIECAKTLSQLMSHDGTQDQAMNIDLTPGHFDEIKKLTAAEVLKKAERWIDAVHKT